MLISVVENTNFCFYQIIIIINELEVWENTSVKVYEAVLKWK